MLLTAILLIASYLSFIVIKLGLVQRLLLAFSPISLDKIIDKAARRYGQRVFFTTDTPIAWNISALATKYIKWDQWSAQQLKETVGYLSALLQQHIKPADRIAICKENHLDIHLFMQAIIRAGGIACPINNKFAAKDMQPYLEQLGSTFLISDTPTLYRLMKEGGNLGRNTTILLAEDRDTDNNIQNEVLRHYYLQEHYAVLFLSETMQDISAPAPPVERSKDDILYLVHSSGTTGFPKAVMLKNEAQSYAVKGWLCYVHVSRWFDKTFLAVPNNHQAVILTFNSALLMGLRVHWYQHYDQHRFDASKVMTLLGEGKYTGFFGFPVVYTKLKELSLQQYALDHMRFWASTADAAHEVIQRHFVQKGNAFRSLGIPLDGAIYMDAQGSSEIGTPSVLRYITRFTRKFGRRIGKPGSTPFGPQIRIRTEDGRLAEKGETGKLEVKGKTLMAGYWNQPALSQQSFTNGWFFTGDAARWSDDGHIIQLDRWIDVIHTKRGAVYSLLIEEKIHHHPAIFDACVYGSFQKDGTQLPAVAVALRSQYRLAADSLLKELNDLLAEEEQLCHCLLMDWKDFPIGITGKTLKRVFRERSKQEQDVHIPLRMLNQSYVNDKEP